jgi:hypothetical protein
MNSQSISMRHHAEFNGARHARTQRHFPAFEPYTSREGTGYATCRRPAENLWGEAVKHAVWLKNRASMRALPDNKTPYEMVYNKKPYWLIYTNSGQNFGYSNRIVLQTEK